MKKIAIILFVLIVSCNQKEKVTEGETIEITQTVSTADYELVKASNQEALLVLFPCFPCDAENTKQEFNIVDIAIENNISVLMLNFNQHLWLDENEKIEIERLLLQAIEDNNVSTKNMFIGGFSSGGNVSLLMTDYLKQKKSKLNPKGVFIVDSPIDLLALYENAVETIEKNYSNVAIEEANWIVNTLDSEFGIGDSILSKYDDKSPYLSKINSLKNLSHLNNTEIRLYTEPDTLWWKENRKTDYEGMNACYINKMKDDLIGLYGSDNIEFIATKNRGYRANGERHPHSWSIVDENDLINWIKGK